MTTNVKVFKSTDANAPALSGTAGALITVLNACLVNGYGGGTVTSLTQTDGIATATLDSHGFLAGQCVLGAGASDELYNGEKYILSTTPNTFTFAVDSGASASPTGTITVKQAPAGWTTATPVSNVTYYRQGGGNQMFWRVDDSPAQFPRLVGYETMSDVNTGTGPFPTNVQVSGGIYAAKSSAASGTARPWVVIATDRMCYLFIDADGAAGANQLYIFGDIKSYKSGDAYGTLITGNSTGAVGTNYTLALNTDSNATAITHYLARSYTQLGSSLACGKHSDGAKTRAAAHSGVNGLTYPNSPDGGLYMAPFWVHEPGYIVRGELPGLWVPCHSRPLAHMDTMSGVGALAGKQFLHLYVSSAGQAASVLVETSNTWSS